MPKRQVIFLYLFLCTCVTNIYSQAQVKSPLHYLLHLQMDSLQQYIEQNPDTSYLYYKSATYYNLLHTLLNFDSKEVAHFFTAQSDLLDEISNQTTTTRHRILQLDITLNNLVIAAVAADNSRLVSTGIHYRNLLGKLSDTDTIQVAYYKHKAIEQVMFAVIINEYPFSQLLLRKEYSKAGAWKYLEKGMQQAHDSTEFYELVLWEKLLYLYFEDGVQQSELVNVPLVRFIDVLEARKSKENDRTAQLLTAYSKEQKDQFPFLYLLQAESSLRMLDISCIKLYQHYLAVSTSELFYPMAIKQLTWAYQLFSVTTKKLYPAASNAWLAIDRSYRNEKEYANDIVFLLRARVLFDGGYYPKALQVLTDYSVSRDNDAYPEYAYRKGRVYHLLKQYNEAITAYNEVINFSTKTDEFAAKACYFAGVLSQEAGYLNLAEYYFLRLNTFKNFPFERTIKQDADNRLQQLKP